MFCLNMWRLWIKYQGNKPYNLKIMVFLSCNICHETWQNPLGKVSKVLTATYGHSYTRWSTRKKTYHATKLKHMFPCFFPKWCIVVIQTDTSWRFLGSAKTNPNKRSGPARSPARSPCLKWSSSSSTGNKRKGMWRTAGFPARAVSF